MTNRGWVKKLRSSLTVLHPNKYSLALPSITFTIKPSTVSCIPYHPLSFHHHAIIQQMPSRWICSRSSCVRCCRIIFLRQGQVLSRYTKWQITQKEDLIHSTWHIYVSWRQLFSPCVSHVLPSFLQSSWEIGGWNYWINQRSISLTEKVMAWSGRIDPPHLRSGVYMVYVAQLVECHSVKVEAMGSWPIIHTTYLRSSTE